MTRAFCQFACIALFIPFSAHAALGAELHLLATIKNTSEQDVPFGWLR
jgi:hypothetical protein